MSRRRQFFKIESDSDEDDFYGEKKSGSESDSDESDLDESDSSESEDISEEDSDDEDSFGVPSLGFGLTPMTSAPPMFAPGATPFASGATPFASGATPFASGATPFASGATPFAPVTTPFAPGATPFAPGATPFAPGATSFAPVTTPFAPVTTPFAPVGATPFAPFAPVTTPFAPVGGTPFATGLIPSTAPSAPPPSVAPGATEIPESKKQERPSAIMDPQAPIVAFNGYLPNRVEGLPQDYIFSNQAPTYFKMPTKVQVLSNGVPAWAPVEQEYISVSQRLAEQKAQMFGDSVQQQEILKWSRDPVMRMLLQADAAADTPNRPSPEYVMMWTPEQIAYWDAALASIEQASKNIKNVSVSKWEKERSKIATDAIFEKYRQFPSAQTRLLSTGMSMLAQASPDDSKWGSGTNYTETLRGPYAGVEGQGWKLNAKNLLGQALMKVRHMYRYPSSMYRDAGENVAPKQYTPSVRPEVSYEGLLQESAVIAMPPSMVMPSFAPAPIIPPPSGPAFVSTASIPASTFAPVAVPATNETVSPFVQMSTMNIPATGIPPATSFSFTPNVIPATSIFPTTTPATTAPTTTAPIPTQEPLVQLPNLNLPSVIPGGAPSTLPTVPSVISQIQMDVNAIPNDDFIVAMMNKIQPLYENPSVINLKVISYLFYQKMRTGCSYSSDVELELTRIREQITGITQ